MVIPFLCCAVLGHKLPEGFYDRGIQVAVYPDSIQVTYELTASDATLRQSTATQHDDVQRLQRVIASGLHIELNRIVQRLEAQTVRQERRHHSKVIFTYKLPNDGHATHGHLVLRDNNFPGCDGRIRMAIVGRDGATVRQSNVARTLQRAIPSLLNPRSAPERTKAPHITAIITNPVPTRHPYVAYTVMLVCGIAFSGIMFRIGRRCVFSQV